MVVAIIWRHTLPNFARVTNGLRCHSLEGVQRDSPVHYDRKTCGAREAGAFSITLQIGSELIVH
jgi:hypothetical protein